MVYSCTRVLLNLVSVITCFSVESILILSVKSKCINCNSKCVALFLNHNIVHVLNLVPLALQLYGYNDSGDDMMVHGSSFPLGCIYTRVLNLVLPLADSNT